MCVHSQNNFYNCKITCSLLTIVYTVHYGFQDPPEKFWSRVQNSLAGYCMKFVHIFDIFTFYSKTDRRVIPSALF